MIMGQLCGPHGGQRELGGMGNARGHLLLVTLFAFSCGGNGFVKYSRCGGRLLLHAHIDHARMFEHQGSVKVLSICRG